MPLLDRIFNKRIIFILMVVFILIIIIFYGIGIMDKHLKEKEFSQKRDAFLSSIASYDYDSVLKIWPEVYTHYKDDEDFLIEFSDKLFDIYSSYYTDEYIHNHISEGAYSICMDYNSFLQNDSFDMVVSAVYDDYLYEVIDYRTFIKAINDFYLFSSYQSPKIVELLDLAACLYDSRQSFMLGESNQRNSSYETALDFYKNVIPQDIIYYPRALEKIDECIELLREQIKNGN
ncbi:MAG: hypothetical protein JW903_05935 [Clostridia bacterium]|nr:hypothetical protein [Clostridia bacterium]